MIDKKSAYLPQPQLETQPIHYNYPLLLNEEKYQKHLYYHPEVFYELGINKKKKDADKSFNEINWERMIERNPILTIYKLALKNLNKIQNQNDSDAKEDEQKPVEAQLRNSVTWLYNKQQTLKPKDEKNKLNEKVLLKHILTYDQQRMAFSNQAQQFGGEKFCEKLQEFGYPNLDFINQFYNLYHYVAEAVDKQQEGIINNSLFVIQPQIHIDKQFFNYFALAVGAQIYASCKQSRDSAVKPNKVVFVNLTGRESVANLEIWSSLQGVDDSQIYYSFIKFDEKINIMEHFQEYHQYYEQMRIDNKCKIHLIPFYCLDNKLTYQMFSMLFEDFMHRQIQKYQPSYIALSLCQSDYLLYEDQVLTKAIKGLSQLCFNKLLLHCHFPDWDQKILDNTVPHQQMLNKCYTAFSNSIIKKSQELFVKNEEFKFILEQTKQIYQILNLNKHVQHLSSHKPFFEFKIEEKNRLLQQNLQLNYTQESPFNILFYKRQNTVKIITAVLENEDQITSETEIKIYYQAQMIIIYQTKLSDVTPAFLYYKNIHDELIQSKNVEMRVKFQKIDLEGSCYTLSQLMNPVVFYKNQTIFILYGTYFEYDERKLNTKLFRFDTRNNAWHTAGEQLNQLPQQMFSGKTGFDVIGLDVITKKFNEKALASINRIKLARISATVCFLIQSVPQNNSKIYIIIFTGENYIEPEIMNLIEIVEIADDGSYNSARIDKTQLYKNGTIKPFPNQIILEGKQDSTRVYLLLPGNDEMRKQKYNHPINTQFSQAATIIKTSTTDLGIFELPIEYIEGQYYNISNLSNKQYNQQLLYSSDTLLVWRVINFCTNKQSMKKKKNNIQYPTEQYVKVMKEKQENSQIDFAQLTSDLFNKSFSKMASELDVLLAYMEENGQIIDSSAVESYYKIMKQCQEDIYDEKKDKIVVQNSIAKVESNNLPNLQQDVYIMGDDILKEEETGSETDNQKYYNNTVKKNFVINDKEIYTVAFESYVFYNILTNRVQIKQFSYELIEPLTQPTFDISQNNLVPPYHDQPKSQQQSIQFEEVSKNQQQQKMQLEYSQK